MEVLGDDTLSCWPASFSSSSEYITSVLRASHNLKTPSLSPCNTLFGPRHSARRPPHHQTYFNIHSKVTAQFLYCGYSHHNLNIHYEHPSRTKLRDGSTRFLHMALSNSCQSTSSGGRRNTCRRRRTTGSSHGTRSIPERLSQSHRSTTIRSSGVTPDQGISEEPRK